MNNNNEPNPHKLYPAILTESGEVLAQQLGLAQEWSEVEVVQIDVIDGFFADNLTVTPDDLVGLDLGSLKIDFHFMVNEPADFVLEAGTFKSELPIRALIGQIERMGSQAEFLEEVKRQGWLRGLSVDLHTPLEEIDESSWADLDILQIMGIEAGAQGQTFSSLALAKIAEARTKIDQTGHKIELIVDGGVKVDNLAQIIKAGADSVAVGSGLWSADEPQDEVQELTDLLND